VTYDREPVLEGVATRLAPGASLALIGPNGAGKSTFLKAIMGLAPVTAGSVQVLGRSAKHARGLAAYVPQAEALDPEFPVSALQVVLMGRYRDIGWLRRPGASDRAAARDALAAVGLEDRAKDRFGTLSGGQRQRVLLARAIAQRSRLLLLDEPFNGVDAVSQQLLLDALQRLRADGVAVVMSTHDLSVAHLACTDACLLNRHQIASGPIATTLTADLLAQTYGPSAHLVGSDATIVTM
jgi:manganese/iron transport system ATP-binding protein